MKWSFRTTKILFACLVACYFLPSCHNYPKFNAGDKTGLTLIGKIRIIGDYISDSSLVLRDSTEHDAAYVKGKRGGVVNWIVDKDGDDPAPPIRITGIAPDSNFPNEPTFFIVQPHPIGSDGQHWQATIGKLDETKGYLEKYDIKWQLTSSSKGTTYNYDPLMQLNPIK